MVLRRGVFSGDLRSAMAKKNSDPLGPTRSGGCRERGQMHGRPDRPGSDIPSDSGSDVLPRPRKCRRRSPSGIGTRLASPLFMDAQCNIEWLLFVLRAERQQHPRERSHRSPPRGRSPRHIAGGSDLPTEASRREIRERLADGRLFPAGSMSVARRGTGRPCVVCGKAITRDTVEREVESPDVVPGLAHEDCYKIWREESRRGDRPESTR
jgi:hypothetical protein